MKDKWLNLQKALMRRLSYLGKVLQLLGVNRNISTFIAIL
jgi:hypothetical protein